MSGHQMFMQIVVRDTIRARRQEAAAHRLTASARQQRSISRLVRLVGWLGRTVRAFVHVDRLKPRQGQAWSSAD